MEDASLLTLVRFATELYPTLKPSLRSSTVETYHQTAIAIERWHGEPIPLADLNEELVSGFMRHRLKQGMAPTTVNRDRRQLLALWRAAFDWEYIDRQPRIKRIPPMKELKRSPVAWTVEEFSIILDACAQYRPIGRWNGHRYTHLWLPEHWVALCLVAWDTGQRIHAILQVRRDQLSEDWIRFEAEQTKTYADSMHRIHPDTLAAVKALPESPLPQFRRLMFPWPLHRGRIWKHFARILSSCGLPSTRKDFFHKFRRSSYTYVAQAMGIRAASEHANHSTDLSRYYLDPRFVDARRDIVNAIPRPTMNGNGKH